MEVDLKNIQWGEFEIGKIFEVFTGNLLARELLKEGSIPRITATNNHNGIYGFYQRVNHKNYRELTNFISISFLGSVFFHSYTASLDMKIHAIQIPKKDLNKDLAEFIVFCLKRTFSVFSYGDQLSSSDLPKKKILLPINSKGEPDFSFMEQFMRQKELLKIEKFQNYIAKRIEQVKDFKEAEPLNQKEWGEFVIEDLFSTKIGKNIDGNKINKNNGKTAYVTRKESNNGLDGFINYEKSFLNNLFPVITIGNETAQPFVQSFPFFTGTKVNLLAPKRSLSRFSLNFISECLKQQKQKYSYSFSINSERLKRQKILLPTDKAGQPDYKYMENYIKKLEHGKLINYLSKKQRILNQKILIKRHDLI